mgnify:CR=1 FL=1
MAFAITYRLFLQLAVKEGELDTDRDTVLNLFFWGIVGGLVGGRLFSVLIYDPTGLYLRNPLQIIVPFQRSADGGLQFTGLQGMSYHGGLVGAIVAVALYSRRKKLAAWKVADLIAVSAPLGYTFGRLGNFINGELYGRVTASPIGMGFPQALRNGDGQSRRLEWVREMADSAGVEIAEGVETINLPRYPSQLFEAFFEGVFLWVILWFLLRKRSPFPGFLLSCYLIGYGLARFLVEYIRQPDSGLDFPIEIGGQLAGGVHDEERAGHHVRAAVTDLSATEFEEPAKVEMNTLDVVVHVAHGAEPHIPIEIRWSRAIRLTTADGVLVMPAVDLLHLADHSVPDIRSRGIGRAGGAALGADLHHSPAALGRIAPGPAFFDGRRGRLLDVNILAGLAGHDRHHPVPVVRGSDHDAIEIFLVQEIPEVAVLRHIAPDDPRGPVEMARVHIAESACVFAEKIEMTGTHPAQADMPGQNLLTGSLRSEKTGRKDCGSGKPTADSEGAFLDTTTTGCFFHPYLPRCSPPDSQALSAGE